MRKKWKSRACRILSQPAIRATILRMKPLRILLLCALLLLLPLAPTVSRAEQTPEPTDAVEATPEPSPTPLFGISVGLDDAQRAEREEEQRALIGRARAQGVYVADASDLSLCYFAKHAHTIFPPGSTTKIMTALLTLENVGLDEIVTTPREATLLGGTNTMLGLSKNEKMRAEDMLYGLMLVSGNDCAISLAFHQCGSEEAFAEKMNERAAALGMVDTNFTNPCGRNVGDNHSTPYDMALLTQDALKNEQFVKIVGTAEYTIPRSEERRETLVLRNSNRLVSDGPPHEFHYPDAIGVKTGATALGTCLITAARREDVTLICVQMGMLGSDNAARREELFKRAIQFFEYVFTYEYTKIDASALIERCSEQIDVQNLPGTQVEAIADVRGASAFRPIREIDLLKEGEAQFTVTVEASAQAPVKKGDVLGTATFSYNGRVWFALPLAAAQSIDLPSMPEPATPIPVSAEDAPTATPTAVPTPTASATPAPTPVPAHSEPTEPTVYALIAGAAVLAIASVVLFLRKKKRG